MKSLKWVLATLTLSLISACGGGGGDAGTSTFGGGSAGCASNAAASSASGSGCPTTAAANLSLQLSAPTINNDGSEKITATAVATTANGQALEGIPVTFTVDNNAVFTTPASTTGVNGQLAATVSAGADPSNRIITVLARSNGLTARASFAVQGAKLVATTTQAVLAPGQSGTVQFRLTNSNDAALANQPISVSSTGGTPVTGSTGVNGDYVYSFTAPGAVGALDITATAGGVSRTQTVLVQSSAVPPAAGSILSASVAANPSVVPTNVPGSTTNRTEIRALFVGAGNAPIRNVRVRFDTKGDPASIGGQFSTGSIAGNTVIYSDSNGIASTAYIPADRASPTNGVTIRACYSPNDFAAGTCPMEAVATITVAADPLAVTIGSNAEILIPQPNLTYQRQFVVLVVDASGRAKGNVDIVPSIDLEKYYKGEYEQTSGWTRKPGSPYECENEDLNRNAVNETGEDKNMNGSLEPRKSDVAVSLVGGSKTKDDGTVIVQIEYPQNVASWVKVKILVSATGVSGTEGRATWTEVLPVPAAALSAQTTPPFYRSPYGVTTGGADPCTNPN